MDFLTKFNISVKGGKEPRSSPDVGYISYILIISSLSFQDSLHTLDWSEGSQWLGPPES